MALQVYTREQFPEQWAATQQNLASAYHERIRGERADNLEQAIAAYELALQVYTREQFPQDWAMTQQNLAIAYSKRIRGERADNLEQAIIACELALQLITREQFPQDWAMTQQNLGLAYHGRIRGEGANNLERAIAAYELALQVYTREQFPQDWASIQLDLANVYRDRIRGERADNLEQAIIACELALQVYTREQFPQDWAKTQKVLAAAYLYRIRGERADNIEQAITAYALALQVYTRENFPQYWAAMQNNLAHAYENRIRGERADNIEQAITAYGLALQVYRPDTLPNDCRRTARNLANLYSDLSRWSDACATYQTAMKAAELLYQSAYLLDGKSAEMSAIGNLPRQAAYALARADDLKAAAFALEQGRARGLSETLERDRSDLTQLQLTNPDLFNQYQGITAQLRNLEAQQRSRITSEERHSLTPETFRTEALRLRQTLTETIKQIRQLEDHADFLAQPDFSDIQQAVRPGVPLVYLVPTPLGSLALMITLQTIEPIWLDDFPESKLRELLYGPADDPELGGWFGAFQSFRNNSKANYSAWREEIERSTRQLWAPLMAPLIAHLKQHSFQQAILIPTGLLSFLPLHTAWTEDPSQPTGKRYALDEIHFTYAPNAKSLTAAQAIAQQTPSDHILAIDNPGDDLPNSSREVTTAISTFPQSIVLPHNQATVAAVKAALPKTDIAHFSCHGTAKLTDPLTSGLLMSDGLITLRDLLDLKLSGDGGSGIRLAILSACETGLSGVENADESISLPTGLLQAGVAGVIASLWAVSDLSTMLLLTKFYELWRTENQEPSEALRQAQIWLRDSTEAEIAPLLGMRPRNPTNHPFSHPYYWAAFSYTGV